MLFALNVTQSHSFKTELLLGDAEPSLFESYLEKSKHPVFCGLEETIQTLVPPLCFPSATKWPSPVATSCDMVSYHKPKSEKFKWSSIETFDTVSHI